MGVLIGHSTPSARLLDHWQPANVGNNENNVRPWIVPDTHLLLARPFAGTYGHPARHSYTTFGFRGCRGTHLRIPCRAPGAAALPAG